MLIRFITASIAFIASIIFLFQFFSNGFNFLNLLAAIFFFLAFCLINPPSKKPAGKSQDTKVNETSVDDTRDFLSILQLLLEFPMRLIAWLLRH